MPINLPTLTVADASAWRQWLAQNNSKSKGVLITIVKSENENPTSLTYPQALDEALCYGWIDSGGHKRSDLPGFHYFRFTPRKPKGLWSKRNVGFVERLEKEGRMMPPGIAAVQAAREDGRWDSAYAGSASAEPPADFMQALEAVPAAKETWEELNRGNRWAIYFRLLNLKTQAGRDKNIKAYVEMLARGETPIPQKKAVNRQRTAAKPVTSKEPPWGPSPSVSDITPPATSVRRTRSGRPAPSYVDKS